MVHAIGLRLSFLALVSLVYSKRANLVTGYGDTRRCIEYALRQVRLIICVSLCCMTMSQAYALENLKTDGGMPVRWPNRCIAYHVHDAGYSLVSFDDYLAQLEQGFLAWSSNDTGISFIYSGVTSIAEAESDGQSVLYVHEGEGNWPYGPGELALTVLQYDTVTGHILEADVAINGDEFIFTGNRSEGAYSIADAIRHEAGHMLGFSHSDDFQSIMFAGPGDKTTLSDNDFNGLQALYAEVPRDCGVLTLGDYYPSRESSGCSYTPYCNTSTAILLFISLIFWFRSRIAVTFLALVIFVSYADAATFHQTDRGELLRWRA